MIYKKKNNQNKKIVKYKKKLYLFKNFSEIKEKEASRNKVNTHFIHFIFIIFTYISAKNEKLFQEAGGRG